MIERRKLPPPIQLDAAESDPMEMDIPEGDLNEDGSMTIDLDGDEPEEDAPFDANLVEHMEDDNLTGLAEELWSLYDADNSSRGEWVDTYIEGLDLLGIKADDRTKPWPGACGVFHPVLTEAVVRFEAQAIMEIFPPQGPAKTKIIGPDDPKKQAQAMRVEDELNYILTEKMTDYRDETESLLFRLALAGSAFRKVYYDPVCDRPAAKFVPAEDFVVAYGETDLRCCGRYTYIDRISANELKRRQVSGFYCDMDLPDAVPDQDRIEEKESDITGIKPVAPGDDRYTVLEMHVDLDLEGFEDPDGLALPYIVAIEENSKKILAIYRNWEEQDPLKKKKQYFVHYKYSPGLGFYGFGLIHLLGGLAKSSTSILRQLIDAGTLCNLPGGLKSRNLRIKGDDSPIRPGEFRDVDVGSGTVRESITFLPYKEPSMVLYQLLGNVVDEGRRVGSIADMDIGDSNQEAPVGTTLALMERALKVMSAVQARLHASLKQELRLISDVIETYMPPQYDIDVGGDFNRKEDFNQVSVVPVSDPGATTMAQRVVQYQAVIQLASQNPQIYDMRKLNLDMLNVLGIRDASSLIPDPADVKPLDPVSENQNILTGAPVKAFEYQDHEAHMTVHMAMLQDPKITQLIQQSPQAGVLNQAMAAHMAEHIAFQYRKGIEEKLGTQLPPMGQPMPPELEAQISKLEANAAPQLLQQHQAEAAQQEAMQTMQDPLVQMQMEELSIKRQTMEGQQELDKARLLLEAVKADQQSTLNNAKLKMDNELNGARLGLDTAQKKEALEVEQDRTATQAVTQLVAALVQSKTSIEVADKNVQMAKSRPRGGDQ